MGEFSDKTVCVYDRGNYAELAIRLSRDFGRTLYFKPNKEASPNSFDLSIGDGFEGVERVRSFWKHLKDVDLFVFPDCYDGDIQLHLESLGKRVWGSRDAENFEFMREFFKKTLKEVGLPVSPYEVVVGMDNLEIFLKENEDRAVKISYARGDRETWVHKNYNLSKPKLDAMRYYYGPNGKHVRFVVEELIETDIEVAYDGFCVDGKFPKTAFQGFEIKNESYIMTIQDYDDLPEEVREVNDKFAPKLAEKRFRSQWGTEIRVADKNYFLDATCRSPEPPGSIVLEMVENLAELLWHGADGELVELETAAPFAAQVMIYSGWADENWQPIECPKEMRKWVKLFSPCRRDGVDYVVPEKVENPVGGGNEHVGSVIAFGETIADAIDLVKERCEAISGTDITFTVESLAEGLNRIHESEKAGLKFTDQEVPDPSSVIEGG